MLPDGGVAGVSSQQRAAQAAALQSSQKLQYQPLHIWQPQQQRQRQRQQQHTMPRFSHPPNDCGPAGNQGAHYLHDPSAELALHQYQQQQQQQHQKLTDTSAYAASHPPEDESMSLPDAAASHQLDTASSDLLTRDERADASSSSYSSRHDETDPSEASASVNESAEQAWLQSQQADQTDAHASVAESAEQAWLQSQELRNASLDESSEMDEPAEAFQYASAEGQGQHGTGERLHKLDSLLRANGYAGLVLQAGKALVTPLLMHLVISPCRG